MSGCAAQSEPLAANWRKYNRPGAANFGADVASRQHARNSALFLFIRRGSGGGAELNFTKSPKLLLLKNHRRLE
jgi:hypothetical protein